MFWAHSDPSGIALDAPGSCAQPLAEHLVHVSALVGELAREADLRDFGFQALARSAGMLHDLGKYTACFQNMLAGGPKGCPHSIFGAMASFEDISGVKRPSALPVAAAIAAHHAGLHDLDDLRNQLNSLSKERSQQRALLDGFRAMALADLPAIEDALREAAESSSRKRPDLLVRMLLSCLVDADRLDTAGRANVQAPLRAAELLRQLEDYLANLGRLAMQRGTALELLQARAAVQESCRVAALGSAQRLSLSVPTGGGKTLAAMRFALERAAAQPEQYRRIVVVIPFLSIIEQNAAVYRKVFGNDAVFEHHSGAVYRLPVERHGAQAAYFAPADEEDLSASDPNLSVRRAETENWDTPVVVTTSVRFFESLFSHHPSDLRRVHNLARSIIILDEVQTLPRRLLAPLLGMLRDLTEEWGCTLLMATATQPAFERRGANGPRCLWEPGEVQEIVPDPAALHQLLQRVRIEWRIEETTPWAKLADEILLEPQALCVVNIRDHAAKLYELLRLQRTAEEELGSIFHLSTRMCAQHRLAVLERIRERLERGLPCHVVSTQLIEAGVDVDFPIAYRALGPLDAVIQVAGRVDREGRLTAAQGKPAGRLIVFRTEDGRTPPNEYAEATAITEALARNREPQANDLEAVQRYFERYYGEADARGRGEDLAEMRGKLKFRTLSEQFEMINSRTKDVFVSYGEGAALIDELMKAHHLDACLLRKLQRYTVGLQPWEFQAAQSSGLIYEAAAGSDVWVCSSVAYDDERGLLTKQDERKLIV